MRLQGAASGAGTGAGYAVVVQGTGAGYGNNAPEISTIPNLFSLRLPPQVRWNFYADPCGTSTFKSGNFMRNLMEPHLLRMEPVCGTLWGLNF